MPAGPRRCGRRPGRPLGGGELRPDVAREIGVGGLPGLDLRVAEDQVAQLGDDRLLGLAVELRDERQIDAPSLVEGDQQPFLGAARRDVTGGVLPTTSLRHDGGFGRLARHLVVVLQRHDQHGVRVFAELDEVGHAADDAAVGGLAEGGLVDRAVAADETVIGPVEFPAGLVAVAPRASLRSAIAGRGGRGRAGRSGRPAACRSACRRALSVVPP